LGDFPDTLAAFLRQQRQPQQHLGCCGIFWHSCRKPSGWEYLEDHPTW
jgi:preprotein translocase subunit Sss1